MRPEATAAERALRHPSLRGVAAHDIVAVVRQRAYRAPKAGTSGHSGHTSAGIAAGERERAAQQAGGEARHAPALSAPPAQRGRRAPGRQARRAVRSPRARCVSGRSVLSGQMRSRSLGSHHQAAPRACKSAAKLTAKTTPNNTTIEQRAVGDTHCRRRARATRAHLQDDGVLLVLPQRGAALVQQHADCALHLRTAHNKQRPSARLL